MASFDEAITVVLKHEGGYSDEPGDPGGPTNFGLSTPFLRSHGLPFFPDEIKAFTKEFAEDVYKRFFWIPQNYEKFSDQNVATKAFDAAVNMGPHQANCLLQRALGALGCDGLVPDGFIGSQTITLVNKQSTVHLLPAMTAQYVAFYKTLAAKFPSMAKFLPEWMVRASWEG